MYVFELIAKLMEVEAGRKIYIRGVGSDSDEVGLRIVKSARDEGTVFLVIDGEVYGT